MSSSNKTKSSVNNNNNNNNNNSKSQPSSSVRTINVLICGDDAVGKTSIIDAKSSGTFSKDVEDLKGSVDSSGAWGEVVVPGDDVNGKQVNLVIIDTSSRTPTKRMEVLNKMKDADVVVLVYAVDNEETFNRLEDHWVLPIQRVCQQHYENDNRFFPTVPIILAANKIDKLAGDRNVGFAMYRARAVPLVEKYSNIEAHVPCSAVTMLDLKKVFYNAQKAVLFPFKPLTNIPTVGELFVDNSNKIDNINNNLELKKKIHFLSEDYRIALKRIFRLLDVDRDGLLNNDEMNLMQVQCFAAGMSHADLAHVKKTIKDEAKYTAQNDDHIYITHSNVVEDDKWTLEGFYELNKAFLRRNRPESPWSILRHFGYGRDGVTGLRMLLNDYDGVHESERLDNIVGHWGMTSNHANMPQLNRKPDQNCELSSPAYTFLENIFKQFKVVVDGQELLREQEVEEIFIIAPENPWRTYRKYNFPWGVPMQYVSKQSNVINSNNNNNNSNNEDENINKQYEYGLTLESWFAMWSMMTSMDYDMTMRYMWYLGFPGSNIESGSIAKEIHLKWPRSVNHLGKAISLKKRRSAVKSAKSLADRQVIRCFVFGRKRKERQIMLKHLTNSKMKRKVSSLEAEIADDSHRNNRSPVNDDGVYDNNMDDLDEDEDEERDDFTGSASTSLSDNIRTLRDVSAIKWFANSGYDGYGKALMMTDIGADVPRKMNNSNSNNNSSSGGLGGSSNSSDVDDPMNPCDVACIVYTATDHNAPSYLANLQKNIPDHIPCVYVGLQENERYNENVFDLISKLCDAYELNHPQPIPFDLLVKSDNNGEEDEEDDTLDTFFNDILKCGLYPETHGKRPISRQKREEMERRALYLKGGIAVATSILIIGLSYFAYSSGYFSKNNSNDTEEKSDQDS